MKMKHKTRRGRKIRVCVRPKKRIYDRILNMRLLIYILEERLAGTIVLPRFISRKKQILSAVHLFKNSYSIKSAYSFRQSILMKKLDTYYSDEMKFIICEETVLMFFGEDHLMEAMGEARKNIDRKFVETVHDS